MIFLLDKGYIKYIGSSATRIDVQHLLDEGFSREKILPHINLTYSIKCPLFVKLALSDFGFQITTMQSSRVELFCPTASDVKGNDLQVSQEIADDIKATGEALIINPKAYQKDGCEPSVSQVNSPLSLYNTIVVSGNISTWSKLIEFTNFPKLIDEYRIAIKDSIDCEYPEEVLYGKEKETPTDN